MSKSSSSSPNGLISCSPTYSIDKNKSTTTDNDDYAGGDIDEEKNNNDDDNDNDDDADDDDADCVGSDSADGKDNEDDDGDWGGSDGNTDDENDGDVADMMKHWPQTLLSDISKSWNKSWTFIMSFRNVVMRQLYLNYYQMTHTANVSTFIYFMYLLKANFIAISLLFCLSRQL